MKKAMNLLLIFSLTFCASNGFARSDEHSALTGFSYRSYFQDLDNKLSLLKNPEEKSELLLNHYSYLLSSLKIIQQNAHQELRSDEYNNLTAAIERLETITHNLQHNRKIDHKKVNEEVSQIFWDQEELEGQERFMMPHAVNEAIKFIVQIFSHPVTAYIAGLFVGYLYYSWFKERLTSFTIYQKVKKWLGVANKYWSKKFDEWGESIDGVWDYWFGD